MSDEPKGCAMLGACAATDMIAALRAELTDLRPYVEANTALATENERLEAALATTRGELEAMAERHESELRATANDSDHARAKALEEAAAVCERAGDDWATDPETEPATAIIAADELAAAIRALAKEGGA